MAEFAAVSRQTHGEPDGRPSAVAWSVAPLVLSPLRASPGQAPSLPGGVAIVGKF